MSWCDGNSHFAYAMVLQFLAKCLDRRYDLTLSMNDLNREIEAYKQSLVLTPNNPVLHQTLAMGLRKRGALTNSMADFDNSIALLERQIFLEPDDVFAFVELRATLCLKDNWHYR